jgi:hypothetical protein
MRLKRQFGVPRRRSLGQNVHFESRLFDRRSKLNMPGKTRQGDSVNILDSVLMCDHSNATIPSAAVRWA